MGFQGASRAKTGVESLLRLRFALIVYAFYRPTSILSSKETVEQLEIVLGPKHSLLLLFLRLDLLLLNKLDKTRGIWIMKRTSECRKNCCRLSTAEMLFAGSIDHDVPQLLYAEMTQS